MSTDTQAAAKTSGRYFTPRRLAHVNLWVENIARSEQFYHEQCGLMIEFTEPDLDATFMGVGYTQHDLGMMRTTNGEDRYGRDGVLQIPGSVGQTVGLNHIAWEMPNEESLVRAFRNLRRDGYEVDTTLDHQIAHSVYLFDPDGNYNEFYCDTTPDWRSILHDEMDLITSRWDPETAEGFTESRVPVNPVVTVNDAAPVHPKRITHAVLESADPERLCQFYRDVGGLGIVDRRGPVTYLRGSLDSYELSLAVIAGDRGQYCYASFELRDEAEFERSLERLDAQDANIERVLDLPWKRSLFLRDPDGLMTEFYLRRPGDRDPGSVNAETLVYAV